MIKIVELDLAYIIYDGCAPTNDSYDKSKYKLIMNNTDRLYQFICAETEEKIIYDTTANGGVFSSKVNRIKANFPYDLTVYIDKTV